MCVWGHTTSLMSLLVAFKGPFYPAFLPTEYLNPLGEMCPAENINIWAFILPWDSGWMTQFLPQDVRSCCGNLPPIWKTEVMLEQ